MKDDDLSLREHIQDGFRAIIASENKKCKQLKKGNECGYFCQSCSPKFENMMLYRAEKWKKEFLRKLKEEFKLKREEYEKEGYKYNVNDVIDKLAGEI